jgi:hypothetical protein
VRFASDLVQQFLTRSKSQRIVCPYGILQNQKGEIRATFTVPEMSHCIHMVEQVELRLA